MHRIPWSVGQSTTKFKHHIAQMCKIAMLNMQRLKQIREFLTQEAACVIARSDHLEPGLL